MAYLNEDDCRRQLEGIGLVLPAGPLELAKSDGSSRRCVVEGRDREKRGWYRLSEWHAREGVFLIGTFGIWEGDNDNRHKVELTKPCGDCGFEVPLRDKSCPSCGAVTFKTRGMSAEEKAAMLARQRADQQRQKAERAREIAHASTWAAAVWRAARPATLDDHDYLARKGLDGAHGARFLESVDGIDLPGAEPGDLEYLASFVGALVVPFMDDRGKVYGVQFILSRARHADRIQRRGRDKDFWPAGMGKHRRYFLLGESPRDVVLVAEGYATAATLRMATGLPVAVAFDAGNVPKVVAALAKRYKRVKILTCADDDWLQRCRACNTYTTVETDHCTHCGEAHGKGNAGIKRAHEAALAVDRCRVVVPVFSAERPADKKGPTDFNDLAALEGVAVVRAQLEAAFSAHRWSPYRADPGEAVPARNGGGWGDAHSRPGAVSSLTLDDIASRFIYVDDDTGEFAFDHWTHQVVRLSKVIKLLPARARFDDLKEHPTWCGRAVYIDQIGFDPGGNDANIVCNRFTGWPMAPKAGSCARILSLLRHLCALERHPDEVYQWIVRWLAYPLQNPGAKLSSALVVHGPQGVGKNMVFEAVARIYGEYGIVINQAALEDKFNSDWTERKLFVLADEVVSRAELHHLKNQLKGLITNEWVRINPKNVAARRERNHMNIVFCSNEAQPVALENDDRRHLVLWTPPKLSPEFYEGVAGELANGGVAALYQHLLDVDLGDWKPWSHPPMTRAKQALIGIGAGSVERFIGEWSSGELEPLPFGPVFSSDLYSAYLRWCRDNGEKFPRTSGQFIGSVEKLDGWSYGHKHVWKSASDTATKRARMVMPSMEAIVSLAREVPDLAVTMPEGWNDTRWCSDGAYRFREAMTGGDR